MELWAILLLYPPWSEGGRCEPSRPIFLESVPRNLDLKLWAAKKGSDGRGGRVVRGGPQVHTGPGASRPAGYSLAFARSGSSSSNRLGSSSRGDRARGVWRFMEFGSRFSSSLVYKDGECRDSGIPPSSAEAGSVRQSRCRLLKGKKFWLGKKKKTLCAGAVNPPPPRPRSGVGRSKIPALRKLRLGSL